MTDEIAMDKLEEALRVMLERRQSAGCPVCEPKCPCCGRPLAHGARPWSPVIPMTPTAPWVAPPSPYDPMPMLDWRVRQPWEDGYSGPWHGVIPPSSPDDDWVTWASNTTTLVQ